MSHTPGGQWKLCPVCKTETATRWTGERTGFNQNRVFELVCLTCKGTWKTGVPQAQGLPKVGEYVPAEPESDG